MFSVAGLLDRAKDRAGIESDYRLAKVIGITQSAVSNYRIGKTMPDARVLEQLCALSGDDLAVVAASIQAERERTPEGKTVWLAIAARLQAGRALPGLTAIIAVVALALAAMFSPLKSTAYAANHSHDFKLTKLYIVSSRMLRTFAARMARLRRRTAFFAWRWLVQCQARYLAMARGYYLLAG